MLHQILNLVGPQLPMYQCPISYCKDPEHNSFGRRARLED
jgi:hypothetical protein